MGLYKHVKRGSIYEVIEETFVLNTFSEEGSKHTFLYLGQMVEAELQFSTGVREGSKYAGPVVLYRALDNTYWLRPVFEFHDGRFEPVNMEKL